MKCKNCQHYSSKYETVGICNWHPVEPFAVSWKNHLPGTIFVTEEREHDCPTFKERTNGQV